MSGTVESVSSLPPVKRHIATHDASGKSIYADSLPLQYFPVPETGGVARSYSVALPVTMESDKDLKAYLGNEGSTSWTSPSIVAPNGANLLVIDMAPGAVTEMHRTVSIDYSICILGEIEHELDGGEIVRLKPSDHIVQRGTMHRWRNASKTEPARFIAVTIPCVPFDIAGKQLEETWIPK